MEFQKILVPVDFSTCSRLVAGQAGALARVHGAAVHLLNVVTPPAGLPAALMVQPDPGTSPTTITGYLVEAAQRRLDPYIEAATAGGTRVTAQVAVGPIVETINRAARDIGADVMVMGTHGRKGLARLALGSVAERVLRTADVPVLMVRRTPRPECEAESCDWCPHGLSTEEDHTVAAELDG